MPKRPPREAITADVIQALKEERLRQGLSMTVLAADAGLDKSYISLLERGMRKPTLDALLRIAEVLNIELWRILERATAKRTT